MPACASGSASRPRRRARVASSTRRDLVRRGVAVAASSKRAMPVLRVATRRAPCRSSSKSSTPKNASASSGAPSKQRRPPRPITTSASHRRRFFVACVTTTTARDSSASSRSSRIRRDSSAGSSPWWARRGSSRLGRLEQLRRDAGALALAAGERADPRVGVLLERRARPSRARRLLDVAGGGVPRQPQAAGVAQRLAHGEARVHDLVLRDVADVGQPRWPPARR